MPTGSIKARCTMRPKTINPPLLHTHHVPSFPNFSTFYLLQRWSIVIPTRERHPSAGNMSSLSSFNSWPPHCSPTIYSIGSACRCSAISIRNTWPWRYSCSPFSTARYRELCSSSVVSCSELFWKAILQDVNREETVTTAPLFSILWVSSLLAQCLRWNASICWPTILQCKRTLLRHRYRFGFSRIGGRQHHGVVTIEHGTSWVNDPLVFLSQLVFP